MKFDVSLASNNCCIVEKVKIKSHKDLKKLQKKYDDNPLVVDFSHHTIIIYDWWLE